MTHITEKVAEFVFEELSATEMAEGRNHLAGCSDCREQVHAFQMTHSLLKTSPDVDLPRRILFEFEKPYVSNWLWRWLAPMAASAAVALAVVMFVPRPQPPPQMVEHVVQQPSPAPVAQAVDYQKIIDELRASDRAWLESELKKDAALQTREIERLRGYVATLDYDQQKLEHLVGENAADVQLIAAKTGPRE
jgi:hypothetical protein